MAKILTVKKLSKSFKTGNQRLWVLQDVSLSLEAGRSMAIVGPSGSGKTTLLGLCAGLDDPDNGSVTLCGARLDKLSSDRRALLRNEYVGFVFQDYQLLTTLTALENVMVPMELRGKKNAREFGAELLSRVGLGDRLHHYPAELSGGEQQRVAIARAFINRPTIIFADEPTGNLDEETSILVMDQLFRLNEEEGTTLVIVSHDRELARRCDLAVELRGGRIKTITRKQEA